MSKRNPEVAVKIKTLSEDILEEIEADPGFQKMMDHSIEDEREGRVYSNEDVKEELAGRHQRHR